MAIELELSVPMVAPQPIVNPTPMPVSTTLLIQHVPLVPYIADPSSPPMHSCHYRSKKNSGAFSSPQECSSQWPAPQNKGKGKAKATEDDNDDKETAQKLRKELEEFIAPITFDNKLLASLLPPPSEYFEGDSRLP
ncbi:hypothetical protein C0995_015680 [Termitomyces sp. Mi166|nr:hypothetical protein C0995_015680 [Termitomyces sp. Mi166\